MTESEIQRQVLQLPIDERLEIAEAIWESLDQKEKQPPLPAWQRQVLDERIAADEIAPEAGSPWDEVKKRILATL